jgi:hypothetical protein
MTIPLPPPTRYTDRRKAELDELQQMVRDNAELHGWTVNVTVEEQPGGLFSALVVFGAGAAPVGAAAPPVAVAPLAGPIAPAAPTPAPVEAAVPVAAPAAGPGVAAGLPAQWNFAAGGRPLTQAALNQAAALGGLDQALLWALFKKETPGASGYMSDRRPLILYERHVFSRNSSAKFDAAHPELSARHKPYVAGAAGSEGYGSYPGQYDRLAQAMALDANAALMACSWGIGQTLGEGFADLGYPGVAEMVHRMIGSEDEQLVGVVQEIKHKNAAGKLAAKDFKGFALLYNGGGAPVSYWTELEANFDSYKTGGLPDLALRKAQMLLAFRGFLTIRDVDGVIGPTTRGALTKFQTANGLLASGAADAATVARLEGLLFG